MANKKDVAAGKIPPHNLDAEKSLLGACLIDEDTIADVAELVKAEDFYDKQHGVIFGGMLRLYEKHKPVDLLTLTDELKKKDELSTVGGSAFLTELTNYVPSAAHARSYGEIVASSAVRRRLIKASADISELGFDEATTTNELLERAEAELFSVSDQSLKQDLISLESILTDSFDRIEELHRNKGQLRGVRTGYRDLDNMTAGLQRSDLFVLAARPAMGKAQPLDAKILTTSGWTTMGQLRIGDTLASTDGAASQVTGLFPQGSEQVYRVTFSDGRTTEASGEHLWSVHYRGWDAPRTLTTLEIIDKLKRARYQKRLWIDMPSGDFGETAELPITPWTLGLLLAEGDLTNIKVSTRDPEILERLRLELGSEYQLNHITRHDYRIVMHEQARTRGSRQPVPLRTALSELGLCTAHSYDKFIPRIYKQAPKADRIAVLQGILDGDGWVETHKSMRFTSCSEQLADDVIELVRSLGGWASKRAKTTHYTHGGVRKTGRPAFVVNINIADPERLFSLRRKKARALPTKTRKKPTFASITPSRTTETQCITVSHLSQLYITDDHIVTHNTTLVTNLAYNVATIAKQSVLFFSLEMSKEQLVDRMLADASGVDSWNIRTGNLSDDDFAKLSDAMGEMAEAPIYIDDTPGLSVLEMRTKARRKHHEEPLGLIIVDYLQLLQSSGDYSGNRVQEVSEISRGLKLIARELNVPLIAISQLSRSVESRTPPIPQLADLRESGSIEQDADLVSFIYRPGYYEPDNPEVQNITDLIIAKHRNGPVGKVQLYFHPERLRFMSLDKRHE
ncbi:replicative DNA helicase [Candidatus Saccharibacteria bacterium]|nr:MAG: replicative DNA helicase [Candidatus Saccharibacteria bacterium]